VEVEAPAYSRVRRPRPHGQAHARARGIRRIRLAGGA
jgi:hypothetical protein